MKLNKKDMQLDTNSQDSSANDTLDKSHNRTHSRKNSSIVKKGLALFTILAISLTTSHFIGAQVTEGAEAATYLTTSSKATPHAYIKSKINGYSLEYIRVDNSPQSDYKVVIGPAKDGGQYLGEIMKDNNAISGMNGAYFSPAAYGNAMNETHSERIHESKDFSKWPNDTGDRTVMGFDKNGKTLMYKTGKNYGASKSDIVEGIGNFPALLVNGEDKVSEVESIIDSKMKSKKDKTFLCSSDDQTVFFGVIKNITIYDMPKVLKGLGCTNALNMDAGASTGLVYNGDSKIGQRSPVMDAIMVVKKSGYSEKEQKKINKLGDVGAEKNKYNIYNGYQKLKKLVK